MAGNGEVEANLESTPTWVVAIVCMVFVLISLAAERLIHYTGKYLKKTNKKPLYQALEKIKEELMLMGFISLLLTVFQGRIGRLCISQNLANKWLPCKKGAQTIVDPANNTTLMHVNLRHLLAETIDSTYCQQKGKVPLLSVTALHHLHIFIFVLAVVHVVMCALTVLFGGLKIRQWQAWEDAIQVKERDPEDGMKNKISERQYDFIKGRSWAVHHKLLGWVQAFFKQFYGSVTESDYTAMRIGFITTHCKGNPKFNFHKYMVRAFESDFKRVVAISWFLWLFVVIYLFLNVNGYHVYFWISFIPLILLFGVGTKLEHVIIQLAEQVTEMNSGDVQIHPSDDHFWFHKPRLLLLLIHITLFQNSFEVAFFFWIWVQYGFDSCIMGSLGYTIPRLVIAAFVQFVCSYSTLPLYAIVTQMGSSFNKVIFEDYIQEGLVDWAHKAKRTRANLVATAATTPKKRVIPKRTMSMPAIRQSDQQREHDSIAREVRPQNQPSTNNKNGELELSGKTHIV